MNVKQCHFEKFDLKMMKCVSFMLHLQRLQNPKIEKAEILDLTVEYLQKWTERKNLSHGW